MKKSFAKIFISFVAVIYVMSTVGVSVFSHYCCGQLEKVSVFTKTKSCCDDMVDHSVKEDGCCKNEVDHVYFQKDFTFYTLVNDAKIAVNQLFIINSSFNSNVIISNSSSDLCYNNKDHLPNLIQKDLVSCSVIII